MFRYSKGEGKEKWKLIENSEKAIAAAVSTGAHFVTVLSIDQDIEHAEEDAKVHYKGPMYFDIDSSDENQSLEDCRRLLLKLYADLGVNLNDCVIHCTGGKGFHILVPAKVFSSGKAVRFLPYTYKKMALEFNLEHLDYGIYSCGKGRMWRLENIKRASGRYKVRLSAAEIFGCSFEEIYEKTLYPGDVTPFDQKDVEFSAEMAALFRRSEFKPKKIITVADDKLQALPTDPECIQKLVELEDLAEGRRFNHLTLALASYAKGRGWEYEELESRAEKIIEEYPSSVYKDRREKIRHIKSIFRYVSSTDAYVFSCQNIRLNVKCELTCCPNCAIERQLAETDYDSSLGIEIVHNCYFRRTDTGRNQLTTFVIVPNSVIEFVDVLTEPEFTMNTTLIADNKHQRNVVFTQPDWASKSALIKKLPHPDFAYIGGDTDVQRLFKVVAQIKVPQKTGVKVIGLHKVDGKWHFVSKEGSIGPNNEENELLLETDYYLPTKLLSAQLPSIQDAKQVMDSLFEFNTKEVVTPLIGWFVASFFKERIFEFTRQFPLLFIFGAAGAGKTQTILNLKRMFNLEIDNIKSIADVTGFTLIKSANSNNTIPLMLDEYKSTTFSTFQVKMVSKLIRAAYNNEVGERGTASQEIKTYFYRAPIILAGEQTVTEPAARDRIIEVHMNKLTSAPHLPQFKALQQAPLEKLGKLLLMTALQISDDEIKELLDYGQEVVPEYFTDRPRLNQAIVIVGLKLLAKVMEPYGHRDKVEAAIREYIDDSAAHHKEDFAESQKSDVDKILEAIALMSDTDERYKLAQDWEYDIDGNVLYLNLRMVYTKFMKFAGEYNVEADAMNYTSALKLLKKEPYFVKDNVMRKLKTGTKLCVALNIPTLKERNLNLQGILDVEVVKDSEDKIFDVNA